MKFLDLPFELREKISILLGDTEEGFVNRVRLHMTCKDGPAVKLWGNKRICLREGFIECIWAHRTVQCFYAFDLEDWKWVLIPDSREFITRIGHDNFYPYTNKWIWLHDKSIGFFTSITNNLKLSDKARDAFMKIAKPSAPQPVIGQRRRTCTLDLSSDTDAVWATACKWLPNFMNRNIVHISASDTSISSSGLNILSKVLRSSSIVDLDLSNHISETNSDFAKIFDNADLLTNLNLSWCCNLSRQETASLMQLLTRTTKLKTLKLLYTDLTDCMILSPQPAYVHVNFLNAISICPSLETIMFSIPFPCWRISDCIKATKQVLHAKWTTMKLSCKIGQQKYKEEELRSKDVPMTPFLQKNIDNCKLDLQHDRTTCAYNVRRTCLHDDPFC